MPSLETKNLTKRFDGVRAVDNLSITVAPGQVTGIIGPNGSGKTTLLNLLSGVMPFNEGAVILEGTKLTELKIQEVAFYGITRTFQEVRLFNQMSVLDNILVVLTERRVWPALLEKHTVYHLAQAEEVLRRVGLWEKRRELAGNLSYGQRKLLEMARVMGMARICNARICLLDEPFAGLFPEMIKIITAVIEELKREGRAIVLVEHNMELIRELSDHLIVMDSGQLLAEGQPAEVLRRREVIEAYLGE